MQQVFGSQALAVELYLAFNGTAPSNPIYTNYVSTINSSSSINLALQLGQATASIPDATLASSVLANLGISAATTNQAAFDALSAALLQIFAAYPGAQRGVVIHNMVNLLAGLEGNATYGAAAATFNNTVTSAYTYASNTANTTPGTVSTGTTFTLTTGADIFTGGTGNDTFNAGLTGTGATLSANDVLDGGAGSDTLNTTASTAGDILAGALVKNIETINVRSTGTTAATLDASAAAGVTNVNANLGTGSLVVTNLATGAAVSVTGDGTVANGEVAFTYKTATDAVTLNLAGGTKMTAGITAKNATGGTSDQTATTATINSTGAANTVGTVDLANATLKSVTVNAASNLKGDFLSETTNQVAANGVVTIAGAATTVEFTAALDNDIKTIDASGLTAGGFKGTLGTGITSFKGGQGADTITTAATTGTGAVIDAGAGTDTLVLAATNDVTTSAKAGQYVNFEVLKSLVGSSVDASLFSGITAVESGAAGASFSKLTAGQAAAVTNSADQTSITYALATATGSSDVLSVTLKNSTATASADLAGAVVTGFETVNIVSSSGSSSDINAVSFAAAGDLTALNLSGAKPISVSTTNITKAAAIDASGLTYAGSTATDYALTLSGNLVKGSSVTGSGAADSITTTAAITGTSGDFVTYNAGAGNDLISTTAAALNNTSGANGSLKIDGGAGTDTLSFTDTGSLSLVDANFQYVTNVEKISYTVANKAISITTGGFFDSNFKASGVTLTLGDATNAQANTVDLTSFSGNATVTLDATAATTVSQSVTTGSGNDVVTVKAAGTTTGTVTVSAGAGNDTINITAGGITTGQVVVNGGAGQDSIVVTGLAVTANAAADLKVIVGAGQSTLDKFDSVTGTLLSNGTDQGTVLDFEGSAAAAGNVGATSVTGYSSGELTYSVSNGMIAFTGTAAAGLTDTQKATIAQTVITTEGATVAWTSGADTYVFNNSAAGDSLVKLVGTTVVGLDANTTGYIDIA